MTGRQLLQEQYQEFLEEQAWTRLAKAFSNRSLKSVYAATKKKLIPKFLELTKVAEKDAKNAQYHMDWLRKLADQGKMGTSEYTAAHKVYEKFAKIAKASAERAKDAGDILRTNLKKSRDLNYVRRSKIIAKKAYNAEHPDMTRGTKIALGTAGAGLAGAGTYAVMRNR